MKESDRKFLNFIDKVKNIRMHMYKYVPPCPNCKSCITGRYVKMPQSEADKDYMERETLKYGEIVRFIPRVPEKNLFCVECGHKWHGDVKTKRYSRREIEEEVEKRGTYEAYLEVIEEQEEKKNSRGFFRKLF